MTAHKEESDEESLKRGITHDELVSQAILFFVAGYDTTAATIGFLAYHLAVNPDKQDKLWEEIERVVGDKEQVLDSDLHSMPYLDMCVSETLRIIPPAQVIDRVAARDVNVKGIRLPAGAGVTVPVYHMHHCEELYPEPEKFKPERLVTVFK